MAATEKQRIDFINKVRDEWGEPHAEAYMEMVPPIDWSQLATKADVAATRADIEHVSLVAKADLEQVRLAMKADLEQLRLATKADLSEAVVSMTNRFVTWMLAGFSAQSAVIGILLVITH